MTKLLTNREQEMLRKMAVLTDRLHDANPEVGMGPSWATCVKEAADSLSFEIDEDDIAEVSESVGGSQ